MQTAHKIAKYGERFEHTLTSLIAGYPPTDGQVQSQNSKALKAILLIGGREGD